MSVLETGSRLLRTVAISGNNTLHQFLFFGVIKKFSVVRSEDFFDGGKVVD